MIYITVYCMVYTIWYIPWYISYYISLLNDIYHGIYHMVYTIWYIPYGIYQLLHGIYHPKVVYTMRQPSRCSRKNHEWEAISVVLMRTVVPVKLAVLREPQLVLCIHHIGGKRPSTSTEPNSLSNLRGDLVQLESPYDDS